MKILAIGDVCGPAGCELLTRRLGALRRSLQPDFVVVNGENATGRGITPELAEDMFFAGADVVTLGNHAFDNRRILPYLDDGRPIVRPLNLAPGHAGQGFAVADCAGVRVCVCALLGRLYMDFNHDSPFSAADRLFETVRADVYVFDFHAGATSEKKAMGYHLDGRASVCFGTHTHVQTSDARVLPRGTGYVTDLGMTGAQESVIGVRWEQSLAYFRGGPAPRFENSAEQCRVQGALFTLDGAGRCTAVQLVDAE